MFLRELADALEARAVPWCVAGGVAVNLHGIPRMTYDIDIVVALEADPLRATREALETLGLRCRLPLALESLAELSTEDLASRNLIAVTFTDPNNPLREVDVLVSTPMPAASLVARSMACTVGASRVPVVCLDDLIVMKRASGRPQDLSDVAHLERVRGA